ncbi:MAG: hypothetical protein E7362_02945 [Clostridiales bacterium]|nr:hypothetical protein [Clostridiales bacterium]
MKKINRKALLVSLIIVVIFCLPAVFTVHADVLSDNIDDQFENLELGDLEEFYNENLTIGEGKDFISVVKDLLSGEFELGVNDGVNYVVNVFMNKILDVLPLLFGVVGIAVFCGVCNNIKSKTLADGTTNIINFVAVLSVALILSSILISIFNEVEIIIKNIANLTEIMSPIILTLMIAGGGKVSAGIYQPAVALLSGGISKIFSIIVIPLIGISCIFNILSDISPEIKLQKYAEFFLSVVKWLVGLVVVIYGFFITAQGITAGNFDGISFKALKYAISNGVPIIGGFVGSGFDLVVAGSILIKNSIGIVVVLALFYNLLSPILYMVVLNLALKLISSITEPISDVKISNFCGSISKSITYLIVSIIMVGIMFFVTILLMIFSANSIFV